MQLVLANSASLHSAPGTLLLNSRFNVQSQLFLENEQIRSRSRTKTLGWPVRMLSASKGSAVWLMSPLLR